MRHLKYFERSSSRALEFKHRGELFDLIDDILQDDLSDEYVRYKLDWDPSFMEDLDSV